MVGEREMAASLAEFCGIPLALPADYPAMPVNPCELAGDFIARSQAVPLRETAGGLSLAMVDPTDEYTIKAVRLAAGTAVAPWAAVPSELAAAVERLYGIVVGVGRINGGA